MYTIHISLHTGQLHKVSLFLNVCVCEQFMTEYDDAELGAPEVEGGGGREGSKGEGGEQWLLDLAVKDFEKNFADKVNV